jgi:hypothetical protein
MLGSSKWFLHSRFPDNNLICNSHFIDAQFIFFDLIIPTISGNRTTAFWDIAQYSLAEVDQHFRAVYCLHHQDDDDDEGSIPSLP